MNHKVIQGTLIPSNTEAATSHLVRNALYRVMRQHQLRQIVLWDSKWDEKGIQFKRSSPVHRGRDDAMEFITALDKVMQTEPAIELCLSGEISLVLQTKEAPIVFRVIVRKGKVSYQEAKYDWSKETTIS